MFLFTTVFCLFSYILNGSNPKDITFFENGKIIDQDHILEQNISNKEMRSIMSNINFLESKSLSIKILVIKKIDPLFIDTHYFLDMSAEIFAKDVFNRLFEKYEDKMLLFISQEDLQVKLVVGVLAKKELNLNDTIIRAISKKSQKYFQTNQDTFKTIRLVLDVIRDKNRTRRFLSNDEPSPNFWLILTLLIMIVIYILINLGICVKKHNKTKKIKSFEARLERIKKLQRENKIGIDFVQFSCGICLNSFEGEDKNNKILMCGHKFHKECLNPLLKNDNFCPFCESKLDCIDKFSQENEIDAVYNLVRIQQRKFEVIQEKYVFNFFEKDKFNYSKI